MRLINKILVAGGVLCATAVMAATAGAAPIIYHPVTLDGKRVRVTLVGAISAQPCNYESGCVKGIVRLKWGTDVVAFHHVRCPNPRNLHMVSARHGARHNHAVAFACGRFYDWRLPR